MSPYQILQWIEAYKTSDLSEWELEFVSGLVKRCPATFSPKQTACIERLALKFKVPSREERNTNPYAALGIDVNSDKSTIAKAVRAAILANHPDKNPKDPYAAKRVEYFLAMQR